MLMESMVCRRVKTVMFGRNEFSEIGKNIFL